jgi:hypothetical protein
MDLFGDHALALDKRLAFFFATDPANGIESLLRIFGPDYFGAAAGNGSFEEFQLFVERGDRFPFSVLGTLPGQLKVHVLLLSLGNDGIVLTNVKIDLATVFPIAGLDGTFGQKFFLGCIHG